MIFVFGRTDNGAGGQAGGYNLDVDEQKTLSGWDKQHLH